MLIKNKDILLYIWKQIEVEEKQVSRNLKKKTKKFMVKMIETQA